MILARWIIPISIACAWLVTAEAQEKAETARLSATKVSLTEKTVYRDIWRDVFENELTIRQKLSDRTKRQIVPTTFVFSASFKVPEGEIIVSSTDTPQVACRTYQSVGLSPALMTCPVRIVLLRQNELRTLYSGNDYTFALGVNEKGEFDNSSTETRTLVTYSPDQKSVVTHVQDERSKSPPSANDSTIQIKY